MKGKKCQTNKQLELYIPLTSKEIAAKCQYLNDIEPKLTKRQRDFCYHYVMSGENKERATILAGYKPDNARIVCYSILRSLSVREGIKQVIRNEIDLDTLTMERNIFKKLKLMMEMDILDYVNPDGTIKKDLNNIPKDVRELVDKIEVKYYGKDADKKVITIEFLGKKWAIEKLMKFIKMIDDSKQGDVNIISDEVRFNLLNVLYAGSLGKNKNKKKRKRVNYE